MAARKRWYPGGPPGTGQLGSTKGVAGSFNPIARFPTWLRAALRLTADEVPNRLRVDHVVPAIEVGQAGWAFADYLPINITLGPGGGTVIRPVFPADVTLVRRLIGVAYTLIAAAPRSLIFQLTPEPAPPAGSVIELTETLVVPGGTPATTAEITQGLPFVVPPGTGCQITASIPAGESAILEMIWAEFPAGYPLPL